MIATIVILVGVIYLIYKFYKKRDLKTLLVVGILFFFQLSQWPLHLPIEVSFGLQSLFAAGILIYEYYHKRKDSLSITFAILFIGFGLIFLT